MLRFPRSSGVCTTFAICLSLASAVATYTGFLKADEPLRSDQQLSLEVDYQLRTNPRTRELGIQARVASGVVTLRGEASSFYDRMRIEHLCRRIDGVTFVDNRIAVVPVLVSDNTLQRGVSERLAASAYLRVSDLRVSAQAGVVTLQGVARSWSDRSRAAMLAKQIHGVAEVRNQLQVNSSSSPSGATQSTSVSPDDEKINNEVSSLLAGEGVLADLDVEFRTMDGEVTLSGSVDSFRKKLFLRELLAVIPGVVDVNTRQLAVERSRKAEAVELEASSIAAATAMIQLAVETALQDESEHVSVHPVAEQIVLSGTVELLSRKDRFERLAKEFSGRRPIRNEIAVVPVDRNSEVIAAELERIFASDAALNGLPIHIEVTDSVVKLSGKVKDFNTKARAVRVASQVAGVGLIENKMLVAWTPRFSDDGLKRSIEKRLQENGIPRAEEIHVRVTEGQAVLSGKLDDADIARKALEIAELTDGIRLVTNQIDY